MKPRAVLLLLACLPAAPLAGQSTAAVDSIVASGIRRGIYPGAVLLVGSRSGVRYQQGYGHLTWAASSPVPSPDSTRWDLASLTKVVGTLPAVATLIAAGKVDPDAPVARYLPRFQGARKDQVTVRMLLAHTSGLPAYVEFFRRTATRDSAIALLYRTPLRHAPGAVVEYSDLNFLLLGLLVEVVSGEPLATYVRRAVLVPAGLTHTGYGVAKAVERETAPTGQWRGHPVCCTVNDQNAARFGGAAGHAGLFSTGQDLARYLRLWLNGGALDGVRLFPDSLARAILAPATPEASRLLGWERPPHRAGDPTPCGRPCDSAYGGSLTDAAFGHTGWTGTLLWADPTRDLFVVFLTNRAYAPRIGGSIRALRGVRGALADAVVRTWAP